MRKGDAFLHDFGLLHGVQIACDGCARYSLVVWFRESLAACRSGGDVAAATDLYRRSARAGVAEGRYSWARHALQLTFEGQYEVRADALANATVEDAVAEVLDLLERAVDDQGHADAAVFLAEVHFIGVPGALAPMLGTARRWRRKAREMGGGSQLAAWERARGADLDRALSRALWRVAGL